MPSTPLCSALNIEIRAMLVRKGLRQEALAEALGITQTQVSARLRASIDWRFAELVTVAERLDVRASDLISAAENALRAVAAEQAARSA